MSKKTVQLLNEMLKEEKKKERVYTRSASTAPILGIIFAAAAALLLRGNEAALRKMGVTHRVFPVNQTRKSRKKDKSGSALGKQYYDGEPEENSIEKKLTKTNKTSAVAVVLAWLAIAGLFACLGFLVWSFLKA